MADSLHFRAVLQRVVGRFAHGLRNNYGAGFQTQEDLGEISKLLKISKSLFLYILHINTLTHLSSVLFLVLVLVSSAHTRA